MRRSGCVLAVAVGVLIASGIARFAGSWPLPALWLDMVFLISAALALALVVSLAGSRLHHQINADLDEHAPPDRGDGAPARTRAPAQQAGAAPRRGRPPE